MDNLKEAMKSVTKKSLPKDFPKAFRLVAWELMKTRTSLRYLKESMDKKMAKVTKQLKTAERDVKGGKPKAAIKALKGAEKKNVKLTAVDRNERDPLIKKAKKVMKKPGCKA